MYGYYLVCDKSQLNPDVAGLFDVLGCGYCYVDGVPALSFSVDHLGSDGLELIINSSTSRILKLNALKQCSRFYVVQEHSLKGVQVDPSFNVSYEQSIKTQVQHTKNGLIFFGDIELRLI